MEPLIVALVRLADLADQLLRRHAIGFGPEHDRRAVRVVRAHEMHLATLHPLEPHPDVGLDVLHDVADMKRPVGIWQRCGDEKSARHCCEDL